MMVQTELSKLSVNVATFDLGVVETVQPINEETCKRLSTNLRTLGLELITDGRSILVERIKNLIIQAIHNSDELIKTNFSTYISSQLRYDYTYLSNVFSKVKGISIQQFIILNKVEKVKELLAYGELNIAEISDKLHYSSAAHLSHQFKKSTGFTPSLFRRLKKKRSKNLEDL